VKSEGPMVLDEPWRGYLSLLKAMMGDADGEKAWVMMKVAAGMETNGFRLDEASVQYIVELEQRIASEKELTFCPEQAKKMILGILTMCSNDASYQDLKEIACAVGNFSSQVVTYLDMAVELFEDMHEQLPEAALDDAEEDQKQLYDVYDKFDADKSGAIDFDEFCEVMRFLNINISRQKAIDIFAKVDEDRDCTLNFEEFSNAISALEHEMTENSLDSMGFTMHAILATIAGGVAVLGILFAFIFMGVQAFTTGTTFGSIVNSSMCAFCGAGVGAQDGAGEGPIDEEGESMVEELTAMVEEVLAEMDPEAVPDV